jgi:uncharacterized protein
VKSEFEKHFKTAGIKNETAKVEMPKPGRYNYPIQAPHIMPGVVPKGETAPVIAMDYNSMIPMQAGEFSMYGAHSVEIGFPGFQYLAMLAMRAEYRAFSSTISSEMTRKWFQLTSRQSDGTSSSDKIVQIEQKFKELNLRSLVKKMIEHEILFGRGQLFISIKDDDATIPLILSKHTIPLGSLERLSVIEPLWTTPSFYNSIDPTAPDFYVPREWYMLGRRVHASRLLTYITRPLPDNLKTAFNFAGISLSQLAEPYVDNWLRTRQSTSDLINNFSITALKTGMEDVLQGSSDGSSVLARAELFVKTRSNRGLMILDKETEDLVQVNSPLSGLHELQAQAQEHMCAVSKIPAVLLTGISPSGLNASSDGEIRVFYDWISSLQESELRPILEIILNVAQLSLFGEIDPDIEIMFVPLYQMTEKELSDIKLQDSQSDCGYIAAGVLSQREVRERIAKDPYSGYHGLDVDNIEMEGMSEDETVSLAQQKAMAAAMHGHSTLGIPKGVGREFIKADEEKKQNEGNE